MAKLMQINYPAGTTTNTIQLTNPLKIDDPFMLKSVRQVSRSASGKQQTAFIYLDQIKDIEITFESTSIRDSLLTFFQNQASLGESFDIIEDRVAAPSTKIECIMDTDSFKFMREAPGFEYWKIKFTVHKVL